MTPHFTKTGLMPGGQCWEVSAERHATAAINQLGWQTQTRGSVVHALQYPTMRICPPVALLCGLYDLVRLKSFLQKIDQKERQESAKYDGMPTK